MARKTPSPTQIRTYTRFTAVDRLEHLLMLISFTTLAITGLVQRDFDEDLAHAASG